MNSVNERELQRTGLNVLIHSNKEDLINLLGLINDKDWKGEYSQVIEILREYVARQDTQGSALDAIIHQFKPFDRIAGILTDFVPPYVGEKALKQLSNLKEERRIKDKIKKLLNRPLEEIRSELYKLAEMPSNAFKPKSMMDTARERVKERKLEAMAPSTGYPELNRYIKGFIPGHVYVLSGDTNTGKSTLAFNFVHRISQQSKTSLYFSLEPENTAVDYLASIRLRKRFSDLKDKDILFDDPNIDIFGKEQIRKIEDLIKAVYSLPRYDFIVIDHIGYFTTGANNLVTKQSDVMKHLAGLAKQRQSAIMIIQHLNKGKINKGAPENNITGSAAFKQDATDVLILLRNQGEDAYGANIASNKGTILIRKSKSDNPQGSVPIEFIDGSALILDNTEIIPQNKLEEDVVDTLLPI